MHTPLISCCRWCNVSQCLIADIGNVGFVHPQLLFLLLYSIYFHVHTGNFVFVVEDCVKSMSPKLQEPSSVRSQIPVVSDLDILKYCPSQYISLYPRRH